MAGELTLLTDEHGFPSAGNDIDTDGYVAVITAFQKLYYADGRNFDEKGYHKLDMLNTKITSDGVTVAKLRRGEAVVQESSGAKGVYDENTDVILTGVQSGTFLLGEKVTQTKADDSIAIGYVVDTTDGELGVCTVSRDASTGATIAFETGQTVTGATSAETTTVTGFTAEGYGLFHFIYRTTTTEFDNSGDIVGDLNGGTISPTAVTAPPHWLTWKPVAQWIDPEDDTITVTNPGLMPDGGSNIGVLCFGRIFLNSMSNPHQWFCTRTNYPLDFDSSQTDVTASTTSQNSEKTGLVGSPIIAMVSYKDQYLIMGCANEVYIMRNDPLAGGINTPISKETGFFSPKSWTWDDQNNLFFLGIDGIYRLSSNDIISGTPPVNITKERIPKLISSMGLNRRTDRVAMGYDKDRYGLLISASQKDSGWATTFWIDLRTGGLFPDKYPTDQSPASMLYYDSYKKSERTLLLGGYDGFIRKYDNDTKNDEGDNAIESWFTVGPFVDDSDTRNKIETDETSITVGEDTDGITAEIYRADSADQLINNVINGATPAATKTLTGDGLKSSMRDKVGGRAIAMKYGNITVDESFSLESINTVIKQNGKKK